MNTLPAEKKARIEDLLARGHGIRAAAALVGAAKGTVQRISDAMDYVYHCPVLKLNSVQTPCEVNLARARETKTSGKRLNYTFEKCLECNGAGLEKVKKARLEGLQNREKKDCPNYSDCLEHAQPLNLPFVPCKSCVGRKPFWFSSPPANKPDSGPASTRPPGPLSEVKVPKKAEVPAQPPASLTEILMSKFPAFDNSWPADLQIKWFDAFMELIIRLKEDKKTQGGDAP